jgi:hypothetical protein
LYWRERNPDLFLDNGNTAAHSCNAWNAKNANKKAFTSYDGNGYLHGRIFGVAYQAHRVIWAMQNNNWPEEFIDHINGIRDDNRLSNLRCASMTDNNRNMRLSVRNKSGCVGVLLHKPTNKWIASIGVNGKSVHLGYFLEKSDAIDARKKAEIKYGYHENHGLIKKSQI